MDRVRSADLETVDATLVGHGAVDRPAIELPEAALAEDDGAVASDSNAGGAGEGSSADGAGTGSNADAASDGPDAAVPVAEVVRLSLDGTLRHVRFERFAGSVRATGAFDAPDLARSPGEGENRLRAWVEDRGLEPGRTVHLDVIEPGYAYGLRAPGEETVYDAPAPPDDSLSAIAEQFERRE